MTITYTFPKLLAELGEYWSFRSYSNSYKFWQIVCWIVFGIPYSVIMVSAILIDYIRVLLFHFANLLALTIVLIPVTYVIQTFCVIIPLIVEMPLWLVAYLFSLPNKALDKIYG